MIDRQFIKNHRSFLLLFCFGWCLVLLTGWFPFLIGLDTFIHFWRVETFASIWLLATLGYLFFTNKNIALKFNLPSREIKLIILPLTAFIVWSAFSIGWATSWKSVLYHTLIWAEYLIFYLLVRFLIGSEKNYRLFLKLLTAVFLLIAVPAIIEFGYFTATGGSTTLGIRFAKYGEQIVAFLPLPVVAVLRFKGKIFAYGTAAATILCLLIFSTLGRTNIVLFGVGVFGSLIIFIIFNGWKPFQRRILIFSAVLIAAPILISCLTFLSEKPEVPIINRMKEAAVDNYSGNFRKLTTSISLEMIKKHPISGIGADNFGMQFNDYRAEYAAQNSGDVNLSVAEIELAERAHNEFLQIGAELGVVGIAIFICFLIGILILAVSSFRKSGDRLKASAALLGLALFLLSSLVSSFSFRLEQNGFVFFFVLAVAVKYSVKTGNKLTDVKSPVIFSKHLKPACLAGMIVCVSMLALCLTRLASAVYSNRANQSADILQAQELFQTSENLDSENPNPHYFLGLKLFKAKRFAESVPEFKTAIKLGAATSPIYNYLAAAQLLSSDPAGAEQTFAEAVNLYPFSTFVRARYAAILEGNGKFAVAQTQFNRALELDPQQARTWQAVINQGIKKAAEESLKNDNYAKIDYLLPTRAVEAVKDEREIVHPEEKIEMNFSDR